MASLCFLHRRRLPSSSASLTPLTLLTLYVSVSSAPILSLLNIKRILWWSRTLSMARALCELQSELQFPSFSGQVSKVKNSKRSRTSTAQTDYFVPKTPAGKESKRKCGAKRGSENLASRFRTAKARIEADEVIMDSVEMSNGEVDCHESCNSCQTSTEIRKDDLTEVHIADSCSFSDLQCSKEVELYGHNSIGNFPSPRELANLDGKFLE